MANRKKKRRPASARPPQSASGARPKLSSNSSNDAEASTAGQPQTRGGANLVRRERKEQARTAREAERKRDARRAAFRRAAIFTGVGLALFGVLWWFQRAAGPTELSDQATAAATAAGCSEVDSPLANAPAGEHVAEGTPITYEQRPPTSGQHYGGVVAAQEPAILTEPLDEPAAVHFLEHAGVIVYHQADGDDALPEDVVSAVGAVADAQPNMLSAPFPDLPAGVSLSLTAWNKELTCPGTVTAEQASTIAAGFAEALVCTSNAPEPEASGAC